MSSAIAFRPSSAKRFVAQHVFEPTSSDAWPGLNGIVVDELVHRARLHVPVAVARCRAACGSSSRSQPSARICSAKRSRPAASRDDVLGRVEQQLHHAAVHRELGARTPSSAACPRAPRGVSRSRRVQHERAVAPAGRAAQLAGRTRPSCRGSPARRLRPAAPRRWSAGVRRGTTSVEARSRAAARSLRGTPRARRCAATTRTRRRSRSRRARVACAARGRRAARAIAPPTAAAVGRRASGSSRRRRRSRGCRGRRCRRPRRRSPSTRAAAGRSPRGSEVCTNTVASLKSSLTSSSVGALDVAHPRARSASSGSIPNRHSSGRGSGSAARRRASAAGSSAGWTPEREHHVGAARHVGSGAEVLEVDPGRDQRRRRGRARAAGRGSSDGDRHVAELVAVGRSTASRHRPRRRGSSWSRCPGRSRPGCRAARWPATPGAAVFHQVATLIASSGASASTSSS